MVINKRQRGKQVAYSFKSSCRSLSFSRRHVVSRCRDFSSFFFRRPRGDKLQLPINRYYLILLPDLHFLPSGSIETELDLFHSHQLPTHCYYASFIICWWFGLNVSNR